MTRVLMAAGLVVGICLVACSQPSTTFPTPSAQKESPIATVLSPPTTPSTTTAANPPPTLSIARVISSSVQSLPDPEGANWMRAFTFADADHAWLALGAWILATADGGKLWRPQFAVDSPVTNIEFISPQRGSIETATGYWQTADGGSYWQRPDARPDDGKMQPSPGANPRQLDGPGYEFCSDNTPYAGPFFALDRLTAWAYCVSRADSHYQLGVRLF